MGHAKIETGTAIHVVYGFEVVEAVSEPCRVREQMPNAHWFGDWFRNWLECRTAREHAGVGKGRNERTYFVCQLQLAFFHQHHACNRSNWLSHGINAIDGVQFDRESGLDVTVAVLADVNKLPIARNGACITGQAPVIYILFEMFVDVGEALGAHTHFFWVDCYL